MDRRFNGGGWNDGRMEGGMEGKVLAVGEKVRQREGGGGEGS